MLDLIAVIVDPVGAGDGGLVALRRDRGARTHVPDVNAEGVTDVAAISDDPLGHAWQLVEQPSRMRQFVSVPRCSWKEMARPCPSAVTQALVP